MNRSVTRYDIFVSYRRDKGSETASMIADRLRHAGYSVFFDVEGLRSGKFNEQILSVIEQCRDFVVVLPEGGLDRCNQPEDWVRREVLCALKHRKNVIPVMLRGFEFPPTMPDGLEELRDYQAVAAGSVEYFDASIRKLRSYLKSRPGVSLQKHWKWLAGAVLVLGVTVTGLFYVRQDGHRKLVRDSQAQVIQICSEMVKVDQALREATSAKGEWDQLWADVRSDPAHKDRALTDFSGAVSHRLGSLPKPVAYPSPAGDIRERMTAYGIKVQEIEAFYLTVEPEFLREVETYLRKLDTYARMTRRSATLDKQAALDLQYLTLEAKGIFYGFLELRSTMPKEVLDDSDAAGNGDFFTCRRELASFRDISFTLTTKEYAELQENVLKEIQGIVMELGGDVNRESLNLEEQEESLRQKVRLSAGRDEAAPSSDTPGPVDDPVASPKAADLDRKRAEVAAKADELRAAYSRFLERFSFTADEGQWSMWGKILRLMTNLRSTLRIRKDAQAREAKLRDQAGREGVDPSFLSQGKDPIPMDRMVGDIADRMDRFVRYNAKQDPNAAAYMTAAKRYVRLLANGRVEDRGLLLVGTDQGKPHPVLRVGDIIVQRKGKALRRIDDYSAAKSAEGPDIVRVLRFDDAGRMAIVTLEIPPGSVPIGLLDLREED